MDMERYGDYNEIDEAPRGKHNPIIILIKVLIAVVCIAVVGILAFRMILFNYYPDSIKQLYFNDTLTEYYNSTNGNIGAVTQEMRFPYDDNEEGNFISDNLIVIRGAGQLQCSLRFNDSIFETIKEKYGVELDQNADINDLFTFTIARDPRSNESTKEDIETETVEGVVSEPVGTLSTVYTENFLMYTYIKLVFDDIPFEDESEPKIEWLRIEVTINGVDMGKDGPYKILVYENNDAFYIFDEYKLSSSEVPAK